MYLSIFLVKMGTIMIFLPKMTQYRQQTLAYLVGSQS